MIITQEDFEDESIADGRAAEVMSQGPPMDVQILKAQILMVRFFKLIVYVV